MNIRDSAIRYRLLNFIFTIRIKYFANNSCGLFVMTKEHGEHCGD